MTQSRQRSPRRTRRLLLMALGILTALGGGLALSGCITGLDLLNAIVPNRNAVPVNDLAYGPGPRNGLDVYRPADRADPAPVVVFFYGGGWQSGGRGPYRFVGRVLTERGFVVVVPDYRVYPEARFPAFIEDGALAVRWVRDTIADHGGDPERIVLMGHSAGAHIAAMLTLDRRYLSAAGVDPGIVRGTIGLAGPYDFLPITGQTRQRIFAVEGDPAVTQPITFARADAPPMLLLTGDADETVRARNSTRLAERLGELGAPAEARLYPGIGHAGILMALVEPFRGQAPVLEHTVAFIRRVTAP